MKKEALLYECLENKWVHCYLCAHHCRLRPGQFGICGVRQNIDGLLYTLVYGQVIAANVDPIEKKPLYHFRPGSLSYSLSTRGCNFKCAFCQNWQISQLSQKDNPRESGFTLSPEQAVSQAKAAQCQSISYTYTEPTVFFEYAYDTARLAKEAGLYNVFVTNGYMTKETLEKISPYLDAANVDLKGFRDDFYKKVCAGTLQPVLDSIRLMRKLNIWMEITTLLIPGQNDSEEELENIAEFIADVGKDIPWHISRFHPDYQWTSGEPTPLSILEKARKIGQKKGLIYVYLGNVLEGSDTYCYHCGKLLVKRRYFTVEENLVKKGQCPNCSALIAGFF